MVKSQFNCNCMFHDHGFFDLINKYFHFALSQYCLIATNFPGY